MVSGIVAEENEESRHVTPIPLVRGAKAIIESLREETGVPKTEALVRILEWFASLPVELRLAVLNRNEDARRRLLKTVIVEMAGDAEAATNPNLPADEREAIRLIQHMAARLEKLRTSRANEEAPTEEGRGRKGRR